MMLPEIRVLIERAEMRRAALEGLLEAVPGDYWDRRAPEDEWSAVEHLRHVATVDDLLVSLLREVESGLDEVWLAGGAPSGDDRIAAMRSVEGLSVEELAGRMRGARQRAARQVGRLGQVALETAVIMPGAVDAWGMPVRWPLRRYLVAWVEHDDVHGTAIRRAISTPPDLSTIMVTQRRPGA